MSVDFKHTIDVACPADEVFAFLADFENNPAWQAGMTACRWTSSERMTEGATYVQQAKFMGKRIDTEFEVTAFEPGQSIAIASTKSTFPIQVTRSVERLDEDHCRVTAHVRGQPTGLLKLFSGMVARSVRKDYAALKKLLEG
jgi:carbon monoxide dehydrogenase subunit G